MSILAQLAAIESLGTAMQKPLPSCRCGGTCWFCAPLHQSSRSAGIRASSPCGAPAERPFPPPRTGEQGDATASPAAGFSFADVEAA